MEGIRLRSDSTGSTKNAFYQGTIVSDSRHSNGIDRDRQLSNGDDATDFSRRERRGKHGIDRARHPPLPRRHLNNVSIENDNELLSPENRMVMIVGSLTFLPKIRTQILSDILRLPFIVRCSFLGETLSASLPGVTSRSPNLTQRLPGV